MVTLPGGLVTAPGHETAAQALARGGQGAISPPVALGSHPARDRTVRAPAGA